MPDMEKVVKGLTEIYDEAYDRWVHRPYIEDKLVTLIRDGIPDALTLLREQEPVKPTAEDEAIRVKYNCGGCGYLVGFVSTIHDDLQYRAKFCPECGKRVKWDA